MKQIIIMTGAIGSIFVVDYFKFQNFCINFCSQYPSEIMLGWVITLGLSILFVVFSLKLSYSEQKKWWSTEIFFIVVVLCFSTVINSGYFHNQGGFYNMDNNFDIIMLLGLYTVFTLGSLVQIYRGYRNK